MLTPGGAAAPASWPALREELRIEQAGANRDGSPAWHVRDPVRNCFFRIGWLEFECLLRWSLGDPARIAAGIREATMLSAQPEDVTDLLAFLSRNQLLQIARPPVARTGWQWLLANYLFIRIPLLRPAQALARIAPYCGVFYRRAWWTATLLAGLVGLTLAGRQWDQVSASLAGAMDGHGLLAFAVALIGAKLLHEFGHAMTATRLGVRVGHMGIALLVLWPMPYTDTGESWRLVRARDRLAIASAGIVAELMLAAWATVAWALAPEGSLRDALFFLATTAWVMTVAINASPFMRFDGYYMVCDALDLPGLHERAADEARRLLRGLLLGLNDPTAEPLAPGRRRALALFALATWLYRLVVFVGIALIVYHAFFKALGLFLFVVEIHVFIVRPITTELAHWWQRRHQAQRGRVRIVVTALVALLAVIALPWHGRVTAAAVLTAGIERPVYLPFAARLVSLPITHGQPVDAGQVLATFDAPSQQDQRAQADAMAAAWSSAARGALGVDEAAARGALAERQATVFRIESRARRAELERLQLVSAQSGEIRDVDPLLTAGSWVSPSQPIAIVVDGRRWRAEAMVAERDRLQITPGAVADVYVSGTLRRLSGQVVVIEDSPVRHLPHALLARPHGGDIALDPTAPRRELRPADTWFRVVIEGEAESALTATHAARVHIAGRPQALAARWADAAISALVRQGGL